MLSIVGKKLARVVEKMGFPIDEIVDKIRGSQPQPTVRSSWVSMRYDCCKEPKPVSSSPGSYVQVLALHLPGCYRSYLLH